MGKRDQLEEDPTHPSLLPTSLTQHHYISHSPVHCQASGGVTRELLGR